LLDSVGGGLCRDAVERSFAPAGNGAIVGGSMGEGANFDVESVRRDFPILGESVQGKALVYLDNAATTQKPQCVIDRVSRFYEAENANIHRGVHYLSMNATDAYDRARERVGTAVGAAEAREIIFVRGATEAINLVARSFGGGCVGEGDEILVTEMEHHANIVPWQMLAEEKGARVVAAPVSDEGEILLEEFEGMLSERVKVAAFTHVSNALGTVNPVVEMTRMAKARGIRVLVDGAQAVPHMPVDVGQMGCDFYVFSGHKVFGPDGIGVLWGREELLEAMAPYQGGGDMIERVSFEGTTFRGIPERFEAGTPNISGAIGLGEAFNYLDKLGWEEMRAHEEGLLAMATERLGEIPGLRLVGTAREKVGVLSFLMDGVHPHDIGTILDTEGVAIRAGHHCAQPLMARFGVSGTARASFAFYNTEEEVEALVAGVEKVRGVFG
jgi:cysteine desulfurase/selenocysteine lyase